LPADEVNVTKTWFIAPWLVAEDMVIFARHAEALGFEGVMGADHGFIPLCLLKTGSSA
jgi:alkanesulfonate monooxygenase SsuD/methylene tetrahydromethanopterin reductase-like flavin-dependent oxidoreductase (luciferase family)